MPEAVEGPGVSKGKVVWLTLEADFDGVEGVFDVLADNAGRLAIVSGEQNPWSAEEAYRSVDNVLDGLEGSRLALDCHGWRVVGLDRDGRRFHPRAGSGL